MTLSPSSGSHQTVEERRYIQFECLFPDVDSTVEVVISPYLLSRHLFPGHASPSQRISKKISNHPLSAVRDRSKLGGPAPPLEIAPRPYPSRRDGSTLTLKTADTPL
ncbi:hypothetical protein SK128_023296, partial [Halocaridina rubra]